MTDFQLKGAMEIFRRKLRELPHFPQFDLSKIVSGNSQEFLTLYRHLLCEYNSQLTAKLLDLGFQVTGATDQKFVENLYKLLRDEFSYHPPLNKTQFFAPGFAEKKIEMATEVCHRVAQWLKALTEVTATNKLHTRRQLYLGKAGDHSASGEGVEIIDVKPSHSSRKALPEAFIQSQNSASTSSRRPHVAQSLGSVPLSTENAKALTRSYSSTTDCFTSEPLIQEVHASEVHSQCARYTSTAGTQTNTAEMGCWLSPREMQSLQEKLDHVLARMTLLENRIHFLENPPLPVMPQMKPAPVVAPVPVHSWTRTTTSEDKPANLAVTQSDSSVVLKSGSFRSLATVGATPIQSTGTTLPAFSAINGTSKSKVEVPVKQIEEYPVPVLPPQEMGTNSSLPVSANVRNGDSAPFIDVVPKHGGCAVEGGSYESQAKRIEAILLETRCLLTSRGSQ